MTKTMISALVRERTVEAAIAEARLGLADGADAVMFDIIHLPPAERTVATFRRMIAPFTVPVQFCLYDTSDPDRQPPVDGPMLLAAEAGAAYVDVSPESVAAAQAFGAKAIVSEHLLTRSAGFEESMEIFRRERESGADVLKLVARMDTPEEFETAKRVMAAMRERSDRPWVYLGLGKYGFKQRFLGAEYGCAMEFALHRPFPDRRDQPLISDFDRPDGF